MKQELAIPPFREDPEGCIDACGLLDGIELADCQRACLAYSDVYTMGKQQAAEYGLTGKLAQIYALSFLSGYRHSVHETLQRSKQ